MTLKAFINRYRITARAEWADENPNMSDMPLGSSHWKVRLHWRNGTHRQMTVPFSMGPALSHEPTAEEVLDCLLSDASGADQDFESWAGDLGYDTDSRKAERTFKAVQSQTAKLRAFLGDHFEDALEADRL